MHAFNQRILAEDLVRVRRPDERERYAAAQRQARIDPNPHQIDAVIFALRRLREGGCILADEVGLGKTIEAGLVVAQSRAEGAQRILLIVPKSLVGQWQGELINLFGIEARENEASFFAPGVYLVGREFAGSERGATPLGAVPPFDLAVIDEAYEIFAGLTMLHLARLLRAPEPADCGISLVRRGQGIHNRTGQRAHGVTALPATVLAHPALADIRRPPSGPDASFPMAHRGRGKEALV